jgi:glutamate-1-semialdehyde 2,1-aminomutase
MYEDAQTVFAMGVGSQVQSFARPYPLYMTHGRGSKLYDVDGNEFIDYLLNYGLLILGHSPEILNDAVKSQLVKGTAFGEPHPLQVEVSKLLIEATPCFEVVNDERPSCTAEDGLEVTRIIEAIVESIKTGQTIKLA